MADYDYPSMKCCGAEHSRNHAARCTEQNSFIEGFGTYSDVRYLHSCDKCGAAVIETKRHLDWHAGNEVNEQEKKDTSFVPPHLSRSKVLLKIIEILESNDGSMHSREFWRRPELDLFSGEEIREAINDGISYQIITLTDVATTYTLTGRVFPKVY